MAYLELNKSLVLRSFQDIVVKAYLGGLVVPITNLSDLKIFGDPDGNSRKYPFFQVYLRKGMPYVNIDNLSEMIEKAKKSVNDLSFINTSRSFLGKMNSKNNKSSMLPSQIIKTRGGVSWEL